jgi:hypothetical protein
MTCFSPLYFVLGVGKLQQMAKKKCQIVGDAEFGKILTCSLLISKFGCQLA